MKRPISLVGTEACLALYEKAHSMKVVVDHDVWEGLKAVKRVREAVDLENDITVWWLGIGAVVL